MSLSVFGNEFSQPLQIRRSLRLRLVSLKGHGNETDFLRFLQKLVPHESLTLPFEAAAVAKDTAAAAAAGCAAATSPPHEPP